MNKLNNRDIKKCIKKERSRNLNLSRDIGYLLFQRTLGMQSHAQLKWHDNTVASINAYLHPATKQITSPLSRDISALLFWRRFGITEIA